jgi:Protein of unknown function (DUF2911)
MKQLCMSLTLAAAVVANAVAGFAQEKRPSPPAQTSTTIGGHAVAIKYGAPSVRGRQIFGGLVPFGTIWRFGANEATALSTDGDLMIGNVSVPKGNYTLYLWPASATDMMLVINKQTGQWGTEYDKNQDLGRVPFKITKSPAPVETLAIKLSPTALTFDWENTQGTVSVKGK